MEDQLKCIESLNAQIIYLKDSKKQKVEYLESLIASLQARLSKVLLQIQILCVIANDLETYQSLCKVEMNIG
jgi:hypothetical protein